MTVSESTKLITSWRIPEIGESNSRQEPPLKEMGSRFCELNQ
ncbi:unnamed protein product [Linum tenue]|uniref:Uncharacterized protein n=1 Tax=Linum tenue TaxID=586396 RepID=A0AAV0LNN9_9ROSI|nr:unnamed protein product [Linum tenue]